jgi:hypothetical protein
MTSSFGAAMGRALAGECRVTDGAGEVGDDGADDRVSADEAESGAEIGAVTGRTSNASTAVEGPVGEGAEAAAWAEDAIGAKGGSEPGEW